MRPAPGILDDDSLREGDAVMTHLGIKIFTGASGQHHKSGDFVSLAQTKKVSKRDLTALLAIDAHRSSGESAPATAPSPIVTGRSVADSAVAAGEMITDPKGRAIRYVGP
jgi:hypothetical protein